MSKRIANTISFTALSARFSTDRKAVLWLERIRWNGKPVCPKCGDPDRVSRCPSHKYGHWCRACRYIFTVKTDTVMHSSKLSVRLWAITFYLVMTARKGVSSLQLSKELGITQKSAWFLLQRVREACKQDAGVLGGVVEVDEAYFGGKEDNKHAHKRLNAGRGTVSKQAVIGARQRGGRVQAEPIPNTGKPAMQGFIQAHVASGATVYTDDHRSYQGLAYPHGVVKHSAKEFVNSLAHTNGIESVWALLKRGYTSTYHNFSAKHLRRYVDEFTFRLNEGSCKVDTLDRMEALARNMSGKTLPYKELIK